MNPADLKEGTANAVEFFSNGYILTKLSKDQLQPFVDEMNKIKSDFSRAIPHNTSLAGNLEHEYLLPKNMDSYVLNLVAPYVDIMNGAYGYIDRVKVLDKPCDQMVHKVWINFQKKHEFNPLHRHSGIASFVIWLKVPYTIENEIANLSSVNAKMKCPANFSFVYTDATGEVSQTLIPVDKKYEGVMCVFPASMYHQVYPFYTSDEYRVSVSGNLCLKSGH